MVINIEEIKRLLEHETTSAIYESRYLEGRRDYAQGLLEFIKEHEKQLKEQEQVRVGERF